MVDVRLYKKKKKKMMMMMILSLDKNVEEEMMFELMSMIVFETKKVFFSHSLFLYHQLN